MAKEWGRRYWSEFRAYLQQEGIQLKARPIGTGDKERFQSFDIGRRTFFLEACFYEQDPETGDPAIVDRLLMRGKDEPAYFNVVHERIKKFPVNFLLNPEVRVSLSHDCSQNGTRGHRIFGWGRNRIQRDADRFAVPDNGMTLHHR